MTKIYIAGPMTGLPDLNYPAFHEAAAALRADGHEVFNPAENPEPTCGSWNGYMRMAIAQLTQCEAIYRLPGWSASKGARLESRIAMDFGLQRVLYPGVWAEDNTVDGPIFLSMEGDQQGEQYAHLNCPACGGSGHVGDVKAAPAAVAVPDEREAFEAWGRTVNLGLERVGERPYYWQYARWAWDGWQARAALAATPALPATEDSSAGDLAADVHPDDAAVDALASKMKAKLAKQRAKSYGGWNTPECTQERLSDMLRDHVAKGDPVDVANFCAFLNWRGEGISEEPQAEPMAWLHQVVAADGEPDQALSFAPDNFPLAGVGGFRSTGVQPLYAAHQSKAEVQAEPVAWTDDQVIRFAGWVLLQGNTCDSIEVRLNNFRGHEALRGIPAPQAQPADALTATPPKSNTLWRLLTNGYDWDYVSGGHLSERDRSALETRANSIWAAICTEASPKGMLAQPADALDAQRWRALLACGRIRLFGTAGVNGSGIHDPSRLDTYNQPYGNYVHFRAEFWSTFPDQDYYNTKENPVYARATLTEFADACRAAMAAAQEGGKASAGKDGAA